MPPRLIRLLYLSSLNPPLNDLPLAARDRALRLRHAVGASAEIPELRHRIDSLVPVNPSDEHCHVAQPRKLSHAKARPRHVAIHVALAHVAWACAAQIFQRKNAVVT